jgi:hypothetical protein
MKQLHDKARNKNENRDEQHPNQNVPIAEIEARRENCHAANNQCNRTKSVDGFVGYHSVV